MKVLHLIDSGGLYGAEKMLLTLVAEQVEQGLNPMILSAGEPEIDEKPLETEAQRLGLPITPWRMKPGLNLREAFKIVKWANSRGYSLFHSHGYKFNILIGLLPKWIRHLPFIVTMHGHVHASPLSKMWVYELMDRVALCFADKVVLVANAMEKELPKRLFKSGKVKVIPNGLNIENLKTLSLEPLEEKFIHFIQCHDPVVLGVGRLSREKNFSVLVKAFLNFREVSKDAGLMIIGEGSEREKLERLIEDEDITSDVLLPGYSNQIPQLLVNSDLLVMPSLTEGMPLILLEAMALGTPVLVSQVGEMPDIVAHGSGGGLLIDLTPQAIATELLKTIVNEKEIKERAKYGKRSIDSRFSGASMAFGYSDIYRRMIDGEKN